MQLHHQLTMCYAVSCAHASQGLETTTQQRGVRVRIQDFAKPRADKLDELAICAGIAALPCLGFVFSMVELSRFS